MIAQCQAMDAHMDGFSVDPQQQRPLQLQPLQVL